MVLTTQFQISNSVVELLCSDYFNRLLGVDSQHYDHLKTALITSSIIEDGLVYLRGGNGNRAYARNIKTVKE
jgi:hypothetical protein